MSDAVEQMGCIRHRETARYFTYYEDYQDISKAHPDKLAAYLRVLEVKTNKKLIAFESILEDAVLNGKTIPELNLWLEISYNDFVYWSLKTMGRSSFQVADKEAEKMLLAKSRVQKRHIRPDDPESPEVQYKEYLLVLENVQATIDGKELPITGKAYEEYGNTPPVIENIPLLKKTWGMLQETRDSLLKKTYPPVEKNRLINKYISNPLKESNKHNVIDDTADADVSTTPQNPLSEKNEEENTTPATTSQDQQPQKPTSRGNAPRRSSASGKGKQSKKDEIEQVLKLAEIAAPKKPDPQTHPYNVEMFMELGDYYRGNTLPKSNDPRSRYQKALKSAMNYVQRKTPFSQVDMVFCYLLGRGDEIGLPELKDQKWIDGGYNTDLWTVESNHAAKWAECQKMERQILAARARGGNPQSTSNPTPGMDHDEAIKLTTEIINQGKEHNYNIQATATSTKTGAWVVKVLWNEGKLTIKSRQHWQTEFAEIHETFVHEQKGVN